MKIAYLGTGSVRSRKFPWGLNYGQTGYILSPHEHELISFEVHGTGKSVTLTRDEIAFGNDVPYFTESK